jgi:hypothetical protein
MLATDRYQDLHPDVAISNRQLFEIHRSKISLDRAKADYSYPAIRLPHTFSTLAGLPTRIHQTVHDGALAFLVVIAPGKAAEKSAKKSQKASKNAEFPFLTLRSIGQT